MQKSRCSTNIPLPKRMSRSSSLSSITRNRDSNALKKNPSAERARSSYLTPLSSKLRSSSPGSARKIQHTKLINNKKWVQEQFLKVQTFIEENHSLFEHHLVNVNNIKPPSVSTFVHLINILFNRLGARVKFTEQNYKELLPKHLKLLNYHATLSNNTLKLVNSMYSFPHIMAMLAWVIDFLINLENEDFPVITHEEMDNHRLNETALDFFLRSFQQFMYHTPEMDKEELKNSLAKDCNVNMDEYDELEKEMTVRIELKAVQETELNKLSKICQEMNDEINKMASETEHFQHDCNLNKISQNNTINQLLKKKNKLVASIKSEEDIVNNLMETIGNQPSAMSEKIAYLQEIKDLEHRNEMKREELNILKQMMDNLSLNRREKKQEIENFIHDWNKTLLKYKFKKSELNKLIIPVNHINNKDITEELIDIIQLAKSTKESYLEKNNSMIHLIMQINKESKNIQEMLNNQLEDNKTLSLEFSGIQKKNELKVKDQNEQMDQIDGLIKTYTKKIKDLNEMAENESKENAEIIAQLNEQKLEVQVEYESFVEKALMNMLDYDKSLTSVLKELDVVHSQTIEVLLKAKDELVAVIDANEIKVQRILSQHTEATKY